MALSISSESHAFGPAASPLRSPSYSAAVHRLDRFAADATAVILLQGESGTGKTGLARRAHAVSPRAKGPFQHVVMSTLDDGLAGSEMFGHQAGAFTDARMPRAGQFVSANGGTIFLDEIGKASLSLQGRLLHVIEYHEVYPLGSDRPVRTNARIIAATNLDLAELVAANRFLPDLYARLATFRVKVPPLRERRADIPLLVADSVARHAQAAGYVTAPQIDRSLMDALKAAAWPHNIRQLDGAVHRLLLEAEGAPVITLGHCMDDLAFLVERRRAGDRPSRAEVAAVLARVKNNVSEAARELGIDRKTLRRILARTGDESGAPQEHPGRND